MPLAPLPRPLTALIGREQAVQEVVRSVRASRLVTLVGGGGVGKTRLAIQVAEEVAADFPAGVAFVELASLADPALLPGHVAAALGVREADVGGPGPEALVQVLSSWLTRHPGLLVLDNCEHLVQAAAALTHTLLSACPDLRILTTSRQRLGLTGEIVWRVPSLPVPDPDHLPVDESRAVAAVLSYPAVQLFAERGAAARSEFWLRSREDAVAVARICQRLDGIPLALELAAARVALLTLPQIAARLDDRFRLLTGGSRVALPRQQTLQALIDWSYDLLPEAERALLGRLSVFAGGWTLEAAEAVCDFGFWIAQRNPGRSKIQNPEVLDLLSALEEKSLVLVELREGTIRYRMLETVREYAREKLAASGELPAVRNRHRDWFLQLAERADAEESDRVQPTKLTQLEVELDNLRAALVWCLEEADADPHSDGAVSGLRLALRILLGPTRRRVDLAEGIHWLESAITRGRELPARLHADALLTLAYLAASREGRELRRDLLIAARERWETALEQVRGPGKPADILHCLRSLADIALKLGDEDLAWTLCVETHRVSEEGGEPPEIVASLELMAGVLLARGDITAARPLLKRRLTLCRQLSNPSMLVHALGAMGHVERGEGNYAQARAYYRESLRVRRALGYLLQQAQALEDLASVASHQGEAEQAIRLLGAAEALCETLGVRPPAAEAREYEQIVAQSRAALGETVFAAAWAEGRAMSLDQAVEYALSAE